MTVRLYADAFRCAIYNEAPGGGNPDDPASPMNRPVVDPIGWLPNIYFHSDLNYYGIAAYGSVSVSHPSVAARTNNTTGSVVFYGQAARSTHLLVTHNLGYQPKFFCIYGGRLIPHGFPVQTESGSRNRFVTAYATSTEIRLWEIGYSDQNDLPATTRNYQVIAFRDPAASPTSTMLDLRPSVADFGRGKFRGGEPHLRADGQGDVLWPVATGKTAGVRNGGLRTWLPNGGAIQFREYNGGLAAPGYFMTSAGV